MLQRSSSGISSFERCIFYIKLLSKTVDFNSSVDFIRVRKLLSLVLVTTVNWAECCFMHKFSTWYTEGKAAWYSAGSRDTKDGNTLSLLFVTSQITLLLHLNMKKTPNRQKHIYFQLLSSFGWKRKVLNNGICQYLSR